VSGEGEPKAAAPLGWTEAIVLLALAGGEEQLPVPPVPKPSPEDGGTLPIFAGALLCADSMGVPSHTFP
jgi:hypothetical protein